MIRWSVWKSDVEYIFTYYTISVTIYNRMLGAKASQYDTLAGRTV